MDNSGKDVDLSDLTPFQQFLRQKNNEFNEDCYRGVDLIAISLCKAERTFSIVGKMKTAERNRLEPATVEAAIMYQYNRSLITLQMVRDAILARSRSGRAEILTEHLAEIKGEDEAICEKHLLEDYKDKVWIDYVVDPELYFDGDEMMRRSKRCPTCLVR